jgi:hypothetical protein
MKTLHAKFTIILSLFVITTYGQERSDFSGEWVLNIAKSKVQENGFSEILRGRAKTSYDDFNFKFWRCLSFKGIEDTLSFSSPVNGQEQIQETEFRKTVLTLSWEMDTLKYVFQSSLGKNTATRVTKFYLSGNALVLVADEKFIAPKMSYHNLYVYDRR